MRTPDDGPAAVLSSESDGDSEMKAETELPSSEEYSEGEDERDSEGERDVSEDDDSEDSDFGRPTKSARRGRGTAQVISMALFMFKLYSFPSFNGATDLFTPSPDPQSCRFLQIDCMRLSSVLAYAYGQRKRHSRTSKQQNAFLC